MIDRARIADLKSEVGEEDFDEIVALFLEETEETVGALFQTNDPADLSALFHNLKGSALNLGLSEFSTQCAKGEALPQSVSPQQARTSFLAARAALLANAPVA